MYVDREYPEKKEKEIIVVAADNDGYLATFFTSLRTILKDERPFTPSFSMHSFKSRIALYECSMCQGTVDITDSTTRQHTNSITANLREFQARQLLDALEEKAEVDVLHNGEYHESLSNAIRMNISAYWTR